MREANLFIVGNDQQAKETLLARFHPNEKIVAYKKHLFKERSIAVKQNSNENLYLNTCALSVEAVEAGCLPLFVQPRSVVFILLTGRTNDVLSNMAHHWVDILSNLRLNLSVIFVLTAHSVDEELKDVRRYLLSRTEVINVWIQSITDLVLPSGILTNLTDELWSKSNSFSEVPATWEILLSLLNFTIANTHYIDEEQFEKICSKQRVDLGKSREEFIKHFTTNTPNLYIKDDHFGEYFVLDINWLCYGFIRLAFAEQIKNQNGLLNIDQLASVLNDGDLKGSLANGSEFKFTTQQRAIILNQAIKTGLVYPLVNGKEYIIPSAFAKKSVDKFTVSQRASKISLLHQYQFKPYDLFQKLLVALFYKVESYSQSEFLLEFENCKAKVNMVGHCILISVAGDHKRLRMNMAVIVDRLAALENDDNITPQILVPLPDSERFADYNQLVSLEDSHHSEYTDQQTGKGYSVNDLLNGVDMLGDIQRKLANFNVFIESLNGIKQLEARLPFSSNWIFLTGNNGYGKTNILQALARGMSSISDERIYNGISPLGDNTTIAISIGGKNRILTADKSKDFYLGMPLLGYGSSRLDIGSESSSKVYPPCAGLFEPQVLLKNIEKEGLSRWYFRDKDRARFEQCVTVFKKLLPNLHDIEVDDEGDVFYIEKDNDGNPLPKVTYKELASGYQNIIAMIGDIMLRLLSKDSGYDKDMPLAERKAVVIIDELELYLHPNWQKRLPQLLTDLFPQVLFIASTHSPLPLLGAPKNSAIYTVKRTAEEGITMMRLDNKIDLNQMQPSTLLSSPLFGMDDIFAANYNGDKPAPTVDTFSDFAVNQALDDKLIELNSEQKAKDLLAHYRKRKQS